MRLLTERENLTGDDAYFESMDGLEHDAAVAHALIQAMENFRSGAPYMDDDWLDALARRASQIMAEWGFDSGEVDVDEHSHAEIAEALKDARRYRWLRDAHESESTKYGLWHVRDYQGEPISNLSPSLDFAIDAAMHNSARELGNE